MKPWVREKLKQVRDLYPTERLNASKARIMDMWQGRRPKGRLPYLFTPLQAEYYGRAYDKEEGLRSFLDEFIARGFINDDYIPGFFPGCKQSAAPAMFGVEEVVKGIDYTCDHILTCPEDIDKLPDPDLKVSGSVRYYLDIEKYYLEECEGEIPVHVCDMQGPVDVAGQLFGYDNLFLCAYDDEKRFHTLLDKCVQAFILLWDAQRMLLGDHFVGIHTWGWNWVPPEHGASLSADSIVMVSDEFFRENYLPHLKPVADKFGKLIIHSCGQFDAVTPAMGNCEFVQAINSSEMPVDALIAAGWPRNKVIIVRQNISTAEKAFTQTREEDLRVDLSIDGLWPMGPGKTIRHSSTWTEEEKAEIVRKAVLVEAAAKLQTFV
ncbi:MAG: hypothetical protein LBJ24_09325 [Treponema sp.]|jgi:hypothetical protein|nr:hypothetical protein [Treponema sp.]